MDLSQCLARRSVSGITQQGHQCQIFTGLTRESHPCLRGLGSGSHLNAPVVIAGDSYLADVCGGRKQLCRRISPSACWKGEESLKCSREGSSVVTCWNHQQTLEKPSPQCCSGLKEAARHACNDARIVNACAREGFVLIAQGFERLDRRARRDVALLGSGFSKLDARAREDTLKLDNDARRNAALLQTIASYLKYDAAEQLKTAAEKHWSDGGLDADLRLADLRAKRRAMEDAYLALQLVKSIRNGMLKRAYQRKISQKKRSISSKESIFNDRETLQPYESGSSSTIERLTNLQDAFWDIASALAEVDGIDYSDPEELELIIATLLDMDAVDGASSATMLAECAKSPDVATRQALANALGNAPSLWALGNAGIGALQRLTKDVNPAIAAAASKALEELRKQWQIDSKDSLYFRAEEFFLDSLYPSEDVDEKTLEDMP